MKHIHRTFGQSLIEFALVIPIILLLFAGFLDIGRAVFYSASLNNAVREATRYAIVHKNDLDLVFASAGSCSTSGAIVNKVVEFSFGMSSTLFTKIEVCVLPDDTLTSYEQVNVSAIYLYKPITPGIKEILGMSAGIPLASESQMWVSPLSR